MKQFIFSLALLFFLHAPSAAQENKGTIQAKLLESTFEEYQFKKAPKRKLISLKNRSFVAKINPVTYVGAGLLFFYQNLISEQIQASCNYEISCSEYTKRSIERYGIVKGTLLGFNQLTTCMPLVIYDYPSYKISPDSRVINSIETEK